MLRLATARLTVLAGGCPRPRAGRERCRPCLFLPGSEIRLCRRCAAGDTLPSPQEPCKQVLCMQQYTSEHTSEGLDTSHLEFRLLQLSWTLNAKIPLLYTVRYTPFILFMLK